MDGKTAMKLQVFFCIATLLFFLCMTNGLDTKISDFGLNQQVVLSRPGHCKWDMDTWHKIGESQRCNCMECTCADGGEWKCKYSFSYCPYAYCNNSPYKILEKKCCCTKTNFGKRSLGVGGGIVASEICFLLPIDETKHTFAPFHDCPEVKQSLE